MVISIHQPDYIPYLGYFYKISKSDKFIFLDDAQYSNQNMHQWNKIKTPQGECRLKIPVEHHLGDKINQVRTRDELGWKKKHLKTIEMNYKKAAFFNKIFPKFEELILKDYDNLADMNISINKWICENFGFQIKFYLSSDFELETKREEKVIDLCAAVQGDLYYSGTGASVYQIEEHFLRKGITLKYTDYKPVQYSQLWETFIPNLSVLDYIFNYGFDWDFIEKAEK